ncbi:hypothetical protein [Photobacterium angustum]|uniref:hypothetical protein n=1 Tax=Photobacterium angustum TaxID=661 RepID=UPI000A708B17|nr:hypothetical protein [Photobacterium angustum]
MKKTLILAIFSISLMGCAPLSSARPYKRVEISHHGHVRKVVKYNRWGNKVVKKTKCYHGHCKTTKKEKVIW